MPSGRKRKIRAKKQPIQQSLQRSTEHLRSWVKANKIEEEFNNEMLSECMDSILKLYGSHKDLLRFLIKYSPKEPLDGMYKVLQKALQNYKIEENKHPKELSSKDSKRSCIQNHISKISTASIENICHFLKRKEIKNFKSCNRTISIICLTEMMKASITICDTTSLLNVTLKPYTKHILKLHHNPSQFNTYHMNAIYSDVFPNIVSDSNCIPIAIDKNQQHYIASNQKLYPQSALIIFNKADITMIQSEMIQNDTFIDGEHIILALHYFNITKQELKLIKYIMVTRSFTQQILVHYIANTLITNDIDGTFDEMKEIQNLSENISFCFMKEPRASFRSRPAVGSDPLSKDMDSLLQSHQKCAVLMFKGNININKKYRFDFEVSNLMPFCTNIREYIRRIAKGEREKLYIRPGKSAVHAIKQQIEHCMTLNNKSDELIQDTMKKCNVMIEGIKLKYSSSLELNIVKHHISRYIFNDVVQPKFIRLPYFAIVPYDTVKTAVCHSDSVVYHIKVYSLSQAPFPFHSHDEIQKPIIIDVKCNRKCSTSDIVNNIIKISNINLFNFMFKPIQEALNNYGTQSSCYAVKEYYRYDREESDSDSDDIFRMSIWKCDDVYFRAYSVLHESHSNQDIVYSDVMYRQQRKLTNVSLYLVPKWYSINDGSAVHRVLIRFVSAGTVHPTTTFHVREMRKHFIGVPLTVWISIDDSLQDIMDNNPTIRQYKDIIVKTFTVDVMNMKLVATNKRSVTKPAAEDVDFVVLSLKKTKHIAVSPDRLTLRRFDEYRWE